MVWMPLSSAEAIKKTDKYLASIQDQEWCFKTEIHKYLKQDVQILLGGVLRLTKEYMDFQQEFSKRLKVD